MKIKNAREEFEKYYLNIKIKIRLYNFVLIKLKV